MAESVEKTAVCSYDRSRLHLVMDSKRHFFPASHFSRTHSILLEAPMASGMGMPRTEPTPIPPKSRTLFGWRSGVQQQRSLTTHHRITKTDDLIRQRLTQTLEILADVLRAYALVLWLSRECRRTFTPMLVFVEVVEDFFLFLHLLNPGTWSRHGTWMGNAEATKLWANALYHDPRNRSRGLGGCRQVSGYRKSGL